jgi:hypothetical protein
MAIVSESVGRVPANDSTKRPRLTWRFNFVAHKADIVERRCQSVPTVLGGILRAHDMREDAHANRGPPKNAIYQQHFKFEGRSRFDVLWVKKKNTVRADIFGMQTGGQAALTRYPLYLQRKR